MNQCFAAVGDGLAVHRFHVIRQAGFGLVPGWLEVVKLQRSASQIPHQAGMQRSRKSAAMCDTLQADYFL